MSKRWLILLYVVALLWWFRRELPLFAPAVRGQVESVSPMNWPSEGIRCTVWDGSEGHWDTEPGPIRNGLYQVGISNRSPVWDYSGEFGEVRRGQTISIWFNTMTKTSIPYVYPHTVVIEPPVWLHFVVLGTLTIALLLGLGGWKWLRGNLKWVHRPRRQREQEPDSIWAASMSTGSETNHD